MSLVVRREEVGIAEITSSGRRKGELGEDAAEGYGSIRCVG